MNGKKLAFLLDFDGPLFNNDLVKEKILSFLGMREDQWKEAYKRSSDNGKYTDYGMIIRLLAEQSTASPGMIWEHLADVMQDERFCSKENRAAVAEFARMGRVEVITQGEGEYQWKKLISSGIDEIINKENAKNIYDGTKHIIKVIEENKSVHLRARLKGLWEDEYTVIQIDDRVDPLLDLQEFAQQQGIWRGEFQQYRINTGKYADKPSPDGHKWKDVFTIQEAVTSIRNNLYRPQGEGQYRSPATMRK